MIRRGKHKVVDYPYRGAFYQQDIDYSVPLLERDVDAERLVWESECDIQEVTKAMNPTLIATFSVFLPYSHELECTLSRGMVFKGSQRGIDVSGIVTNVVVSELDGIVAYVKDYDTDESID